MVMVSGCAPKEETPPTPPPEENQHVISADFEEGTMQGWEANGASISITTEVAHSGSHSLYVYGRSANWHSAQIPLKGILESGKTYSISVWVYQESGSDQNMGSTMKRKYSTDESTQYDWIKHDVVPSGEWTELAGTYTIPADVSIDELTLYVEAPDDVTLSYYIDDLVIDEQ